MTEPVLLCPAYLLADPAGEVQAGWAVRVRNGRIDAVGPVAGLAADGIDTLHVPDALLLPGLINAHQHGRGISQVLLGYPDDALEPWIARRRARGAPDAGALTRLAALEMLKNGVTCAVHANYSYGSGDYEAEVRAALDAYIDCGLRVTFCVGAMDRGELVYPGHDAAAFLDTLSPAAAHAVRAPRPPAYAGDAAATIALMRRLQADYGAHPLVTLAYGPAGPQWVSHELLAALARDAAEHGLGLHLHALESPTQRAVATRLYPEGAMRALRRMGALGPRTTLAHCVHADAHDIDEIARAGASVVHNPGSNLRLGNGLAPVAALHAAGVPVALGTDNCALSDDEDLLTELHLADLLARRDGFAASGRHASDLLRMVTTDAARAAFVEDRAGRIAVGLSADMMALNLTRIEGPYRDADMPLLDAVMQRARGADVVLTLVAGKVLCRDGCVNPGGEAEARAAAAATARAHRRSAAEDVQAAFEVREGLRALYRLR